MSLNKSLVLVILGEDRPGLVEKVAALVKEHHANWLESHLSRMAGHFGGMIHILIPSDRLESFTESLAGLQSFGLTTFVRVGSTGDEEVELNEYAFEVVGQDRPGIVSRISEAIATRGVNVRELRTEYSSAPMSGSAIFKAKARLQLPATVSIERLRQDLEQIASDLMIDISAD